MLFILDQVLHFSLFWQLGVWAPFVSFAYAPCLGLWPIFVFYISLRCYGDLEGSTNFWGLLVIPNLYYPFAFFILLALLSQSFLPGLLCGLIFGWLEGRRGWDLGRFLPSRGTIARYEAKWTFPGAFLGGRCIQPLAAVGLQQAGVLRPAQQHPRRGTNHFTLFAGPGQRLGSGPATEPLLRTEP